MAPRRWEGPSSTLARWHVNHRIIIKGQLLQRHRVMADHLHPEACIEDVGRADFDIPGYRVIRELAGGGMATVYLATQESLLRQVAVKVMKRELARNAGFRARFLREAQLVARLNHPGIVTVPILAHAGDTFFLSMEYLPGGTLKERIASGLAPGGAIQVLLATARALAYAHRQGVVHRDIKPNNILFRADGSPVVTDFGIARLVTAETQLTAPGLTVGSPRYMSPEQILGQKVDARSDLFSLGIVFHEMLTGQVPWADSDDPISIAIKRCNEPIPRLPATLQRYQGLIDRLVVQSENPDTVSKLGRQGQAARGVTGQRSRDFHSAALAAKSPDERYPDADAFAQELAAIEATAPPVSESNATVLHPLKRTTEPTADSISPPPRRLPRKALLGAAGMIAAAATGWTAYVLVIHRVHEEDNDTSFLEHLPSVQAERPIAGLYEKLAIEHLRKRQFRQSRELIAIGLKFAPGDARLLALEDIAQARERAAEHLEAAEDYAKRDLLEAASMEAEQGLALAPRDQRLVALSRELQDKRRQRNQAEALRLLSEARALFHSGDLNGSLARVTDGLALVKDHPDLLSLRSEVEDAIARQRQLDGLRAKAHLLANDGRWNDASTVVSQGLSLDPGDADLKALKQQLEARLNERRLAAASDALVKATANFGAGDLEQSLSTIEEGLRAAPDHTRLLQLRRDVLNAIDQKAKVRDLLAKAQRKANGGDLEGSLQLVAEGLRLAPNEKRFAVLRHRLDAERRLRVQREADRMIQEAEDAAKRGQLDQAFELTAKALKLQPKDTNGLRLQGELRTQLDERSQRQRDVKAMLASAKEALAEDKPQEALKAVEQLLALEPNQPDAPALKSAARERLAAQQAQARAKEFLGRAKSELDARRLQTALDQVAEGLKAKPGDTALITLKTQIEADLRTQQQASELVATAREKMRAGDYEAASSLIQKAHAIAPDDARITALRGEITAQLQRKSLEQRVLKLQQQA
jgi:serine/threonine protein kinase